MNDEQLAIFLLYRSPNLSLQFNTLLMSALMSAKKIVLLLVIYLFGHIKEYCCS